MVMKFRKKPIVIEAMQYTDNNEKEIIEFAEGNVTKQKVTLGEHEYEMMWCIKTLEGVMHLKINDWVIKGIKNEFYPCKPDVFDATYERVD